MRLPIGFARMARLRKAQPALFGVAALCFLLPFAELSCGPQSPSVPGATSLGREGDEAFHLKGYQLVIGQSLEEEIPKTLDAFALDASEYHTASEPFAVIALVAALAGLGLTLSSPPGRSALRGLVAGLTGVGSLVLLGMSPLVRALGALRVTWKIGYWACLVLFAAAAGLSYLMRREELGGPGP